MNRRFKNSVAKYMEFHQLQPEDIKEFPKALKMPERANLLGPAIHTDYRSWKWGETADYTHDHDSQGVNCYEVGNGDGQFNVPKFIQTAQVVVKLGDCLSWGYTDYDTGEDMELEYKKPYPGLYCTSNGKGLLIIRGGKIEALVYGGKLDVKDVGIIG